MPPRSPAAHLERVDPNLAPIVRRVGRYALVPRAEGTHFGAVVRSIMYQQLSGKAAATIHGRFEAIYANAGPGSAGAGRTPEPRELLETPDEALRAAGVSRQKVGYLRDLAARVDSGDVPMAGLDSLGDDQIVAALTRVKGVGRWTAQMFLMFRLGRPDVLPDLDLGIQKGIQLAYRLDALPSPKEVLRIGEKWAPYRTAASWYLWRSLDNGDGQAGTL